MEKLFKPKNREELFYIIKTIINNQEKDSNYQYGLKDIHETSSTDNIKSRGLSETFYPYGLKDVDTSLITDMKELFSCYIFDKNSEINRKIDWNDPRNDITAWNVSNVTNMEELFYESQFNQNISNWNISNVTKLQCNKNSVIHPLISIKIPYLRD